MTKRVNEISAGLKNIEAQLTVKTENIFQAKELQKVSRDPSISDFLHHSSIPVPSVSGFHTTALYMYLKN